MKKEYEKRLRNDMLLMFFSLLGFALGVIMMVITLQGYVELNIATPVFIGICLVLMVYGLKQASDDRRKLNEIILDEINHTQDAKESKYQTDRKKKKK
ncbi:MAG: hypothetical protein IKX96_04790 [Firmicutes bacterium]|nr:hypothetical protein [Bacillota bacterium]MBR5926267.1 hypothetical protein [Bacillota bacterium]MBR6025622.1 hypothetical protein [Bacillota bacterium]